MGDVWHFQSIYELQFFNCPACDYREKSKQKFIDHASNVHPESATYLMNVSDIDDVVCPWNEIDMKEENIIDNKDRNMTKINENSKKENAVTVVKNKDERSVENESDIEILEDNDIIESKKMSELMRTLYNSGSASKNQGPAKNQVSIHYLKEITTSKMQGAAEQIFKCEQCGIIFHTERHLKIHTHFLHEKTKNKEYCDICDIQFKTSIPAMKHFEEVHLGTKTVTDPRKVKKLCQICGKSILQVSMKTHMKLKHEYNEELHSSKCELCGKIFKTKSGCTNHKQIDHEGKRYKCDSCDYTSMTGKSLKKHIRTVHEGIVYQCEQCGKVLTTEASLQEHVMAMHENIKDFQCDTCKKNFVSKNKLRHHEKQVHGDKRHVCYSCGMSFATSIGLKRHDDSIHKGLKNFECNYCKEKFSHYGGLKSHIINKHEQDKKVGCDQCEKKFATSHLLKNHVLIVHEGIKNFACVHCSKKFGKNSSLQLHITTVHEGLKPHKCEVCGTAYGQKGDLKRHKLRAHPNY